MKTFCVLLSIVLLSMQGLEGVTGVVQKSYKRGLRFKWLIFPGTKYCGPGNVAKSWNDLGKHRATDSCCRTHDKKCKIRIKSYGYKYNTWNTSWKVKSHCSCEKKFKDCLEKVNTSASKRLFDIYFKMLEPDCIKLKTVKYKKCVKRSWLRCVKYKTAYKKKAVYYNLQKELNIQ